MHTIHIIDTWRVEFSFTNDRRVTVLFIPMTLPPSFPPHVIVTQWPIHITLHYILYMSPAHTLIKGMCEITARPHQTVCHQVLS